MSIILSSEISPEEISSSRLLKLGQVPKRSNIHIYIYIYSIEKIETV